MTRQLKPGSATNADQSTRETSSAELLGGRRELHILHNGERYTLRITSNNRLILIK